MPTIHALLIGINGYPISPLKGCINDVEAISAYLSDVAHRSNTSIRIRTLTDNETEQPTRENIIKSFSHFTNAKDDDVCVFYYSGHGSFSPAPRSLRKPMDSINR
ncbi:MAG: caspase family protein [Bacteroidota bacterium]